VFIFFIYLFNFVNRKNLVEQFGSILLIFAMLEVTLFALLINSLEFFLYLFFD